MATRGTSALVESQIPEFIRNDGDKFITFLEEYYKFLDSYNLDITNLRDVDLSPDALVTFLRREFVSRFPSAAVNDRQLIKVIREIYASKGTTSAIELMFRVFFNEAVTVYAPNKDILRASDGVWEQLSFVTLDTEYLSSDYDSIEALDPITRQLKIVNSEGVFFVDIEKTEQVMDGAKIRTRFFFKAYRNFNLIDSQSIDIVSATDTLLYRGTLVRSPSKLSIITPGKAWKVGKLIYIDAEGEATIAIVKRVGVNGELLDAEIIQYGQPHIEQQTVITNPYPNKPPDPAASVFSVAVGFDPLTQSYIYEHSVQLSDSTAGTTDTASGISNAGSYFLGNYDSEFYSGTTLFTSSTSTSVAPASNFVSEAITIDQYLAATTELSYEFGLITKTRGEWVDGRGQLSNPNIRMHDGYFYQLFSYVIKTTVQLSEFKPLVDLIHPAGMKVFGDLEKTATFRYDKAGIYRTIGHDVVYANDVLVATEDDAKHVTSVTVDTIDGTPDDNSKQVISIQSDGVEALSIPQIDINMIAEESTYTAEDGEPGIPVLQPSYDSEGYFEEIYAAEETLLTIG